LPGADRDEQKEDADLPDRGLGIDLLQGFFFGRPEPIEPGARC